MEVLNFIKKGEYEITISDGMVYVESEIVKAKYRILDDSLIRRNLKIDNSCFFREYSKTLTAYWTKRGRVSQKHKDMIKEIEKIVINAVSELDKNIFYIR